VAAAQQKYAHIQRSPTHKVPNQINERAPGVDFFCDFVTFSFSYQEIRLLILGPPGEKVTRGEQYQKSIEPIVHDMYFPAHDIPFKRPACAHLLNRIPDLGPEVLQLRQTARQLDILWPPVLIQCPAANTPHPFSQPDHSNRHPSQDARAKKYLSVR
jgi:hypothetical protein